MGKTKKCKECGSEIPKGINMCPYCGAKQKRGVLKIIGIVFAALFILTGISSANNGDSKPSSTDRYEAEKTNTVSASVQEETKTEVKEVVEKTEAKPPQATLNTCTPAEKKIYVGNGVTIEIANIDVSRNKTKIEFELTSNSDKDWSINAHSYSINGVMAGTNEFGFGSVELAAGKKAKLSLDFDNAILVNLGMTDIGEIQVIFWAYADYMKQWDSGLVSIKTDKYSEETAYCNNTEPYYSDETISVWYLGHKKDDYEFMILNKSDKNAGYTIDGASVNDWSYDLTKHMFETDLYDKPIHSGSYDCFTIPVVKSFKSDNKIDDVKSLEFHVSMKDDYWDFHGDIWKKESEKINISNP